MKLKSFDENLSFYEVNIWIYSSLRPRLFIQRFTTKREAFLFIDTFKRDYKCLFPVEIALVHFDLEEFYDFIFFDII